MRQDVLLTERARQLAAYQLAQAILTRPQAPASNAAAGGWGPPERGPAPFANTKGLERVRAAQIYPLCESSRWAFWHMVSDPL